MPSSPSHAQPPADYPAARASERALWAAGDVLLSEGRVAEARIAWQRAARLGRGLGSDDVESSLERRTTVADRVADDLGPGDASFRLPGPGQAPGPVPVDVSESWSVVLPDHPFRTGRIGAGYSNLVPLVHGERVLINTTLEVMAFDSFTGAELWRSQQPEGWAKLDDDDREDLADALDRESQLIAPAVGSGVAVGALQIPFEHLPSDNFQGFVITRPLPDRRLFAFDLETGETLWKHEPPPFWDGNSGTFTERMSVAGSPVIAGNRVIAPMCRMDGRVDLRLAAFDLASGELLWETPVISGQRELNMFNRHEREFSAPPVRVEGDTVAMLTQLGTVAAVDLLTGATRWQAVYDQLPLPQTQGLVSLDRPVIWKNAPPVIADGVVLATPIDSDELVAFDLEDGRVLWSQSYYDLRPRGRDVISDVDALIGAEENEVLLGGGWIVSWRKPQGLDSWAPLVPGRLKLELGTDVATSSRDARRAPRATVGSDRILVPGRGALISVERSTGKRRSRDDVDWLSDERGNLAIGPGAIYVASNRTLRGMLDLSVLEDRALARVEAAPDDAEAVRELGRLLARRAGSEFDVGRTSDALRSLERARNYLEPLTEDNGVLDVLVANLRDDARYRKAAGSIDGALERWSDGLAIARTAEQIRDLRLDQLPTLRNRDAAAWSAALDDLAERAGNAQLAVDALEADPDWRGFVGSTSSNLAPVSVAAWVEVQRGLAAESRGHFAEAMVAWQAILFDHATERVDTAQTVGVLAVARIRALLELGGTQLYLPFEELAREELASALEAGDVRGIERIPDRYPFASAAVDSRRALIDQALAESDTERASRAIGELLALSRDPGERARLRATLAVALGRTGNVEFERALLGEVAKRSPDLVLELDPYRGQTVRAVVDQLPTAPDEDVNREDLPGAIFGSDLELTETLTGDWRVLGAPPRGIKVPDGESPSPVLVVRGNALEARPADDPGTTLWSAELPLDSVPVRRGELWTLTPGQAIVGSLDRVVAVDLASGRPSWSRTLDYGQLESLVSTAGVVVATTSQYKDPRATYMTAFDAVTGAELWRITLPTTLGWWPPLAADGRLCVLAVELDGRNQVLVLDPFTGERRGVVDLPDQLGTRADRLPWIQADRLILPSMYTYRITAIDLEELDLAWSYEVDDDLTLYSILRTDEKFYVHTTPGSLRANAPRGALVEVDPRVGSRRTIHQLERGESVVGQRRGVRTDLNQPYVFLTSRAGSGNMRVTAVDLRRGRRWGQELTVREEQFFDVQWARVGVSERTVALIWAQRLRRGGGRHRVWMDVFDLKQGIAREHMELSADYTEFDRLELHAIQSTLWIGAEGAGGAEDRIELWSDR
ncbi:MAG: outer membrane protein assembly factor BamB family protein [Planctomycetota bacterium]